MTYPALNPQQAYEDLARFRIIDVREPHEFNGPLGRIASAESKPLGSLSGAMASVERNASFLLVCRSGGRSGKACEMLQEQGFHDVTNLAGGMIEWNRRALPIVTHDPEDVEQLLEALMVWMAQVTATSRPDVEARVGAYLREAGAGSAAPTTTAVAQVLERVSRGLEGEGAPADLDLVIAALRRALAAL